MPWAGLQNAGRPTAFVSAGVVRSRQRPEEAIANVEHTTQSSAETIDGQ